MNLKKHWILRWIYFPIPAKARDLNILLWFFHHIFWGTSSPANGSSKSAFLHFFRAHLWKDSFSCTFLWLRCFYIKYFKYWSILDLFLQIFTCTAQTICLHIWRHVYICCSLENFSFQMDCFYMLSIPKFEWLTCSK